LIRKITAAMAVLAALVMAPLPASAATSQAPAAGQVAASVAMPPERAEREARPAAVMVVRGDTLSALSARWCGSAGHYANLAAASGIGNYDLIYPGQRITLDCHAAVRVERKAIRPTAVATRPIAPAVRAAAAPASASGSSAVVAFALAQVGKRYVWAAAGPFAYDCSGLVVAAFARIGVRLPHQSGQIMARGTPVSRANLRPGDVIGLADSGGFYHVLIYIGNGRVVEAANPQQGVRTGPLYAFSAARRFTA